MSWFDEAIARRRREERAVQPTQEHEQSPLVRQQQEVAELHPLIERLLTEFGEHVYGKSFWQKRFLVHLERPAHVQGSGDHTDRPKSWNWHWHLYSLVRTRKSVEVHPNFATDGSIQGFTLMSGDTTVNISSIDEEAIKEALVSLYLA